MVDWYSVTKACSKGGLGIPDLSEMNVTLLVKWIYCYGNESDRFWRRVICAKNDANPSSFPYLLAKGAGGQLLSTLLAHLWVEMIECPIWS